MDTAVIDDRRSDAVPGTCVGGVDGSLIASEQQRGAEPVLAVECAAMREVDVGKHELPVVCRQPERDRSGAQPGRERLVPRDELLLTVEHLRQIRTDAA